MLERIVADKRVAVAARKAGSDVASRQLTPSDRSLEQALRAPHTGLILECKKASPSRGLIREDFSLPDIAASYRPFADAISVLTDAPYFQGSLAFLEEVRSRVPQPVLCKDFVVDPFQVSEARAQGADAILLMCSVLDDEGLRACLARCGELSVDALVEVRDRAELDRALQAGARIVGINNRNLDTLRIDLATTETLAPHVPDDVVLVGESGVKDHHDLRRLRGHVDALLIGSALMGKDDLDHAVRTLAFGRTKICGLTRPEQAAMCHAAGASHGGVVLWPSSKRAVDLDEARAIVAGAPLGWVGVFVDEEPARVAQAAEALSLHAVQLHGSESPESVSALRAKLPAGCAIWKAARVGPERPVPSASDHAADRLLLDTFVPGTAGGTGRRFDWSRLPGGDARRELILSGGIDPGCAAEADALGCWGLDLSSGVELSPGEKSPERVAALMTALRGHGRRGEEAA